MLCYLRDPACSRSTVLQIPLISTWQENIRFLVTVMKCITLQIYGNSTNKKMRLLLPWTHTNENITAPTQYLSTYSVCAHTECIYTWAESHICNDAVSYLCRFASSKHLRHSVWAFILCSVKCPETNTAAQRVARREKYFASDPLSDPLTDEDGSIDQNNRSQGGRFPKMARTLVIVAVTEWYILY